MKSCCLSNKNARKCIRLSDKKIFSLPRKYTKHQCLKNKQGIKGFSKKSSCAPYKDCNRAFDVYTNQNPSDTISIKYKTYNDVKDTIYKLEHLYKSNKYSHKRIWQVAMILMVRLRKLSNTKNKHYMLSKKYFTFLKKRTTLKENKRREFTFKF